MNVKVVYHSMPGIIPRVHPGESDLALARELARDAVVRRAAASGK